MCHAIVRQMPHSPQSVTRAARLHMNCPGNSRDLGCGDWPESRLRNQVPRADWEFRGLGRRLAYWRQRQGGHGDAIDLVDEWQASPSWRRRIGHECRAVVEAKRFASPPRDGGRSARTQSLRDLPLICP
jgi:hypothetical protein